MTRADIETEVVLTLRQCALRGSDRELSLDKPLGQLGLGLDSLALLEFVAAVERRFARTFSDEFWTQRGELTLHDVVDEIVGRGAPAAAVAESTAGRQGEPGRLPVELGREPVEPGRFRREAPAGYPARVLAQIREQGLLRGSAAVGLRALWIIRSPIYRHEEMTIMSGSLSSLRVPDLVSSLKLEFGEARTQQDLGGLEGFWEPRQRPEKLKVIEKRFNRGYLCLTARHEGEVVGLDWVSGSGDDEELSGVRVRMRPDACYGLDLAEHRLFKGKGVGLALLAFSLEESRKRGYLVQLTLVNAGNRKMASTLAAFFGFRPVGRILTERVLGKPFSRWVLGQQSGRGEILLP